MKNWFRDWYRGFSDKDIDSCTLKFNLYQEGATGMVELDDIMLFFTPSELRALGAIRVNSRAAAYFGIN